jgi:epoxyqueuosine reductase
LTSILDLLQAETQRLGFPLFGVAPAAPPPHYATFRRWVEDGLYAGMSYLSAERSLARRADPRAIEPEARSVLVVGMRYAAPSTAPDAPASEPHGRVAAYAWGADYHDVIPPRLAEIGAALEKHLGQAVRGRSYTDTGPVLERDFAQQAGLGWIGKNTCLISPSSGSYYLLGETLLDVEIEPSVPLRSDHCGSCTRCIEACPTAAIRPDRTINSGRCISYLTIENKGPIPPELRSRMGEWVFGCDICQTVCPWNLRFAAPEGHPALAPREGAARPALREILRLTPQDFNRNFRGSPLLRAKRRGYLRNACVASGNAGDTAAVPDLAETLRSETEPLVRAHAAWALGQLRTAQARAALEKSLPKETDPAAAQEIRSALEQG